MSIEFLITNQSLLTGNPAKILKHNLRWDKNR